MPDVGDFSDQTEWMRECVPQRMDEGEEQDQAVAVCLAIWREGKSARNGSRRDPKRAAERWSCGAASDIPIADTERDWNGSAAATRMLDRATTGSGEDEKVNGSIAKRGFLIYDAANSELRGSYSCPFADIVSGQLKVIPSGLRAAASRLPQVTDVSQEVKDRARGVLDAYFEKMNGNGEKTMRRTKQDYGGYDVPGVREDEDEDDFHDRCVSAVTGQGADAGEANSVCALAWENRKYKKPKRAKQDDDEEEEYDVPDVDEDETQSDFNSRCQADLADQGASEDEATDLCGLAWENRSAGGRMRYKTHVGDVNNLEFCMSDATPDRMGDIIDQDGWDLSAFIGPKKNAIALFNHSPSFVVGEWLNVRVENGELRGRLRMAAEGTSDRIDEIRKLVDQGILKAVSVGFRPIESRPRKMGDKVIGEYFTKQALVECSLVSVPANPNALAIAKSLDISSETLDMVFAEHGFNRPVFKHVTPSDKNVRTANYQTNLPASMPSPQGMKEGQMSLAQRIQDCESRINVLRDKLTDHLADVDDSNVSDTQLNTTQDLNDAIKREILQRDALVESERNTMGSRAMVPIEEPRQVTKTNGGGVPVMAKPYIQPNGRSQIPSTRDARMDIVVRGGAVSIIAHLKKCSMEVAREEIHRQYPTRGYGDAVMKVFCDYVSKAPTDPAMTSVIHWAEELVQTLHGDYLDLLYAMAVAPRLFPRGMSLSFGRAGRISIPTRDNSRSVAGSFVGEGMPIPVRQAMFTALVFVPKKMAVITTWTREMGEASIPAIEGILRNAIQEDTAEVLDSFLLDAGVATAIRPPGLLAAATIAAGGSGALVVAPSPTPTPADRFTSLVSDLQGLSNALLVATRGNLRDLVYLMNPSQTLAASLVAMPGVSALPFKDEIGQDRLLGYPIIRSGHVPLGTIIAMDAADFVVVGGEAPRFEVSDTATLHFDDSAPQHINDGTPAQPVRSLWQTDSIGLRLILPINWSMRRDGMVASVTGTTWGV